MMKTVITSRENHTDSLMDPRFGRCAFFCLYNEDTRETSFLENTAKEQSGGAGTQAAEKMIELGVKKVLSGDFGPKAKDLLDKFGIQMVVVRDHNPKISDLITKLQG